MILVLVVRSVTVSTTVAAVVLVVAPSIIFMVGTIITECSLYIAAVLIIPIFLVNLCLVRGLYG